MGSLDGTGTEVSGSTEQGGGLPPVSISSSSSQQTSLQPRGGPLPVRDSTSSLPRNKSAAELLEDLADLNPPPEPTASSESVFSLASPISPNSASSSSGAWLNLAGPVETLLAALSSSFRTETPDETVPLNDVDVEQTEDSSSADGIGLQHPRPEHRPAVSACRSSLTGGASASSSGITPPTSRSRSPRLVGKLSDLNKLTSLVSSNGAKRTLSGSLSSAENVNVVIDRCESAHLCTLEVASQSGDVLNVTPESAVSRRTSNATPKIWDLFPGLAPDAATGKWSSLGIDRAKVLLLDLGRGKPSLPTTLDVTSRTRDRINISCEAFKRIDVAGISIDADGSFKVPDAAKPLLGRSGPVHASDVFPDLTSLFGRKVAENAKSAPNSPARRPVSPIKKTSSTPPPPRASSGQLSVEPLFEGATKVAHADGSLTVHAVVRVVPSSGGWVVSLSWKAPEESKVPEIIEPTQLDDASSALPSRTASDSTDHSTTSSLVSDPATLSQSGGHQPPPHAHHAPPESQLYNISGPSPSTAIRISQDPGISGGHGHVRRGWFRGPNETKEVQAVLKFVERDKLPCTRIARYQPTEGLLGPADPDDVPVEVVVLLTLKAYPDFPPTLPNVLGWGATPTHYWIAMEPVEPFPTSSSSSIPGIRSIPGLPLPSVRLPHGLRISDPAPPPGSMDLFELIEWHSARHMVIPELVARKIFKQVAGAVAYLHSRGSVHRDIKDENVIVGVPGIKAQLADFGSAAFYPPDTPSGKFDTFSGTLDFAPPEILKGIPYDGPQQDVWSLGCLLFTLWTGDNPFKTPREAMEWDGNLDELCKKSRRRKVAGAVKKVLGGCLEVDLEKRWSAENVLLAEWVQKI